MKPAPEERRSFCMLRSVHGYYDDRQVMLKKNKAHPRPDGPLLF
jgi:hypothetical protein